jgi:hypothetical protein
MFIVRRMYQNLIPEPVRARVWQSRQRIQGVLWPPSTAMRTAQHELQWLTRSADAIREQQAGKTWAFMLGTNNSGTTLFQRIMEAHPHVGSLGTEGQYCTKALDTPESLGIPRIWTRELDAFRWTEADAPETALRAAYDWLAIYPSEARVLFEKSPPNTIRSRWLQAHFPNARFIVTYRHPYAVCEGMRRRGDYSIRDAAHHWTTANQLLRKDLPTLNHVYMYTYEDFCEHPTSVLSDVADFLGLDRSFPTSALKTVDSHSLDGRTQGIQNMNARSIARLSSEDIDTINEIAGSLMSELGYVQRNPVHPPIT